MQRGAGRFSGAALFAIALAAGSGCVVAGPLVVYCTHDQDACELAAQTVTRESGIAFAIYRIVLGFGTNPELLAKRKVVAPRCWADLVKPDHGKEIELVNPVTSGTG